MTEGHLGERAEPQPRPPKRARRVLLLAAVVGFALPIGAYLWLIHTDGVDMLRADQWYDVRLIGQSYSGHLTLGALWAQHAENRIFVQNLLTLLLAHTTHYNVLFEEYLSAALLTAAAALLILAHRRRTPSTPWLAYCPVAIVLLSIAQWGNTLLGFQVGWFIIMLALAATLFLLDGHVLTRAAFAAAVVCALIGSTSSLQGLFIWPAGLALLLQRRRPKALVLTWIGCSAATALLYFYHWTPALGGGVSYVIGHPLEGLRYFFFAVGDVLGVPIPDAPGLTDYGVLALGVLIVALGVWSLITCGLHVDQTSASPIGAALIWFGLLFAAAITGARTSFGLADAGTSRYATFDLLILMGSYLALLDRPWRRATGRAGRIGALSAMGAVAAILCLQVVVGSAEGVSGARAYRGYEETAAAVTVNIKEAPDGLVENQLAAGYQPASFIRRMAHYAMVHRLSLFSTDVSAYRRAGLPVDRTPPTTTVVKPMDGAVLRGAVFLVASATDKFGVAGDELEFSGMGRTDVLIGRAVATPFGWLAGWNTTNVPDGHYTLQSVAHGSTGLVGISRGVVVTVDN